jgi:hypothetical protein
MYRTFLSILFVIAMSIALSAQTSTGEKTTKSAHSKSGTITGCLSGPNDEGAYMLKNSAGHSIEVGGSDELKAHVGHEVKLSGTWAKSGSEIGENEAAEHNEKHATAEAGEKHEAGEHHEKREARERHFKVSSISMVSDTCSASARK